MTCDDRSLGGGFHRFLAPLALFLGSFLLHAELSWLERESGSANELKSVVAGSEVWVTAGERGTILTSPDRLVWTERLTQTNLSFAGVGHGAGRFVAVGSQGAIWTSADGVDWTAAESNDTNWLFAVTWASDRFLVAGDQGTILTSTNAAQWTAQPRVTDNLLSAVTARDSLFVAVGFRGAIVTSTDATNWTAAAWDPVIASDTWLRGVAYGKGLFVAVGLKELSNSAGHSGLILTSTNATDWTPRDSGFEQPLDAVVFDGKRFVAVGEAGIILASENGVDWTGSYPAQGRYLHGVAANPDGLVAVGTRGTILISTESAVAEPIVLSQPRRDAEGIFSFLIEGAAPGQTLSVEASSDLVPPWEVIGQLEGEVGPVRFSDPAPATGSRRFYRVQSP